VRKGIFWGFCCQKGFKLKIVLDTTLGRNKTNCRGPIFLVTSEYLFVYSNKSRGDVRGQAHLSHKNWKFQKQPELRRSRSPIEQNFLDSKIPRTARTGRADKHSIPRKNVLRLRHVLQKTEEKHDKAPEVVAG
jgi:hypothetical protein